MRDGRHLPVTCLSDVVSGTRLPFSQSSITLLGSARVWPGRLGDTPCVNGTTLGDRAN